MKNNAYLYVMNYEEVIAQKEERIAVLEQEKFYLERQIEQMRMLIFGSKRERFIPVENTEIEQLSLFEEQSAQDVLQIERQNISYERNKPKKPHPGRNEIPDHFPVTEIVIEPQQDTTEMVKVGEEVTEYVDYTAASLVKVKIIRPKYAPKEGEGKFVIADLPARALPKSIASESLLTHLIVRKFIEHMPFYRQIESIKREYNWAISSSTLNDWFTGVCVLLEPLYNLVKQKVIASGYVQVDESPIKVQDSDKRGATHRGYQWVYHSPEQKLVYFDYRKGRGENGPKEILAEYKGLLQCDGYSVYDKIGAKKGIKLAGCMVHLRRYFFNAKDSDKLMSDYALDIFRRIYQVEAQLKGVEPEQRKKQRNKSILPLLNELKQWVDDNIHKVLPKSPIGKAMQYATSQWPKIMQLLKNGRFELDNNLIENKIRPLALGRKNYLFAGSHEGARRIAMMYSFMGSCAANNINPADWLKTTLLKINDTKFNDLELLMPNNFRV